MSQSKLVRPEIFLTSLIGTTVIVKLKWGNEYRGLFTSYDPYFNVQLSSSDELIQGQLVGPVGDTLIRSNNILYIRKYDNETGA